MIPVTPQSGGGSYGGYSGYGNNQFVGINSDLLQMLHQLIAKRLGPTSIGTNGFQIKNNGADNIGYLNGFGEYIPGFQRF